MSNISLELEIKAPKEKVYSLLADPDKMIKWLDADDILIIQKEDILFDNLSLYNDNNDFTNDDQKAITENSKPEENSVVEYPAYYLTDGSRLDFTVNECGYPMHYQGYVISCKSDRHLHLTIAAETHYYNNHYKLEDSETGTHLIFTSNSAVSNNTAGAHEKVTEGHTKKFALEQLERLKHLAEGYPG